jgi:sterol desaturase/sphingolipid hydroxylase (fatty acid hydroxylase superfamily)
MLDVHPAILQSLPSWLHLGQVARNVAQTTVLCGGLLLVIAGCEYRAGLGLPRYASRHFALDLLYRLVFVVYLTMLWNPLTAVVRATVPALNVGVLLRAPLWVSIPIYWLVFDFIGYWIHRMQHSRWLWRFHRVHHSQVYMTFATGFRNHPIDQLFALSVSFVPGLLMGAPSWSWLPFSLAQSLFDATHHANLPWRFGWARKVFVSPVFHAQHHSTDAAAYDRNFGGLFSMWDFLFGTAVDAERPPERTGVEGWRVAESFWAHLLSPFRRGSVVRGDAAPQSGA